MSGGKWSRPLPLLPEVENYAAARRRKGRIAAFGEAERILALFLKLAKNKPIWTIQAQLGSEIGQFNWGNRKLSWRELAALQTFPSDFLINGARVEIEPQIAVAAPSLLAEALGRSLTERMFNRRT
jgi:DNA (cytosine-5)-methyltransferase 1